MSSTSEASRTPISTKPLTGTAHVAGQQAIDASRRTPCKESRRRDKPQLSCHTCRRRKLRCDRRQPCSTCSSRGLLCVYGDSQGGIKPLTSEGGTALSVQDRLVHLERLVMSLMPPADNPKQLADDLSPKDSARPMVESMDVPSECGSMHVSDSDFRYVGGDHWAAILDSITDLKDHLNPDAQLQLVGTGDSGHSEPSDCESTDLRPGSRSSHALLLYGPSRPTSRANILAALPPKVAVDRYVARYFNSLEIASCIVHGPTFLKEYEAFWTNPSRVPVVWIGLLFSIIGLAVVTSDTGDRVSNCDLEQQSLQIDLYREKIVQCLIAGEYTNAGVYVLETMLHYLHVEFAIRADADKDAWFLLAIAVNVAMRAGYHRDPGHFPDITPLQCEMRRRTWATVLQADILISTQMGMPRMVSDPKWDAAEPRNYNDADLSQGAVELPPPRPETEFTTTLGIIARRRMLMAVGIISDLTCATTSCSYADVMRVDGLLLEAAASIPPPLKHKPLAASVTDPPQVIMGRLFISHVFYKGQIMLHRRFLYRQSPSTERDHFAYSRKVCLDASLDTLQIQRILDEETCTAGQLHTMRWRLSSIMNHQFLTATMILCSLLHRGQTLERADEIVTALQRTRTIWMRGSNRSREARRAAETLNFVLARAAGSGQGPDVAMEDEISGSADAKNNATVSTFLSDMGCFDGNWFDRQNLMLQEDLGLVQPDAFIMPTLLGAMAVPDQQNKPFPFPTSSLDSALGSSGDMTIPRPGSIW
ncbi:hypothetical protein JDV02_004649 [Purpureocillium takamizusanense]|uniref:Zn(2)-C6 fungal-type domain-containing protein n=1 Tax=Purpureocillium takamizusanense TaxID=2060973 RepID=A0A9Q8VB23_9HYPO|nr:uncharacterized protein JDV02_004649 [Purpureocillium takamizusanense]UNI18377.1 hypothetical protein JDV02_004649 [Purpureocillium takamizusanense]